MTIGSGIVDPIRAIEKGAPIAIWRVDMQAPPYALLAKPAIKSIKDLQGQDHQHRRRQGHHPHLCRAHAGAERRQAGRRRHDVFAGATSARLSALQSGAVDAAMLTSPYNFYAEAAGFSNLGWTIEYARELPFSGGAVNRTWAVANKPVLDRFVPAYNKAVNWFQDRKNRADAVKIMMEIGRQKQEDVEKSYDFLQQGKFLESTGKVPRGSLSKLIEVLQELGDMPPGFTVDRLLMPGVAEIGP